MNPSCPVVPVFPFFGEGFPLKVNHPPKKTPFFSQWLLGMRDGSPAARACFQTGHQLASRKCHFRKRWDVRQTKLRAAWLVTHLQVPVVPTYLADHPSTSSTLLRWHRGLREQRKGNAKQGSPAILRSAREDSFTEARNGSD